MLPPPVLERARQELMSLNGSGVSVMEMSHRSDTFGEILQKAAVGIRDALSIPENYHVLFLQGGATMQFSMVPMNLLSGGRAAEYIVTGAWGKKAFSDAALFGDVRAVYSTEATGFRSVPEQGAVRIDDEAAYVHYTSNETIDGVEFKYDLDGGRTPVVCDMSSNILSKPVDIGKYALIYAGAQKNIGPSGVTVVIIREDMIARVPDGLPGILSYNELVENDSMVNTPNTWGIYLIGLVCDWLRDQGGVAALEVRNQEKAAILYDAIDSSDGYYMGHAETAARSLMNVTFRLSSEELEEKFCREAEAEGMVSLKGHRSVGGIRASIYNAFPIAGVEALVEFMTDFSRRNG